MAVECSCQMYVLEDDSACLLGTLSECVLIVPIFPFICLSMQRSEDGKEAKSALVVVEGPDVEACKKAEAAIIDVCSKGYSAVLEVSRKKVMIIRALGLHFALHLF